MQRFLCIAGVASTLILGGCGGGSMGNLSLLGNDDPAPQLVATITPPPPPEARDPSRGKTLSTMMAQNTVAAPQASSGLFASLGAPVISTASLAQPGLYAPSSVQSELSPVAAYAALAIGVKKCWLAYAKPKLPNHNFDGEASLDNGGQAKIAIYERAEGQKLGRFAFRIDLKRSGNGTLIESVNVRLSERDSEKLLADIARWSKGEETCSS